MVPAMQERLSDQGIWELATTLEFPLVGVLATMEHNGILVDRDYLERFDTDLGNKVTALESAIQSIGDVAERHVAALGGELARRYKESEAVAHAMRRLEAQMRDAPDRLQWAMNQWQCWQPLANAHRPLTRNPPSTGVATPVGLNAPATTTWCSGRLKK
jgi:hypothetical protein